MQRFDLRHLGNDFYTKMEEILTTKVAPKEVAIFLFEVGDFTSVQESANLVRRLGCELMNSLKFNEVDWTIIVKRSES